MRTPWLGISHWVCTLLCMQDMMGMTGSTGVPSPDERNLSAQQRMGDTEAFERWLHVQVGARNV